MMFRCPSYYWRPVVNGRTETETETALVKVSRLTIEISGGPGPTDWWLDAIVDREQEIILCREAPRRATSDSKQMRPRRRRISDRIRLRMIGSATKQKPNSRLFLPIRPCLVAADKCLLPRLTNRPLSGRPGRLRFRFAGRNSSYLSSIISSLSEDSRRGSAEEAEDKRSK